MPSRKTAAAPPRAVNSLDEVSYRLCELATGSCDCSHLGRQACQTVEGKAAWIVRHVMQNAEALKRDLVRHDQKPGGLL